MRCSLWSPVFPSNSLLFVILLAPICKTQTRLKNSLLKWVLSKNTGYRFKTWTLRATTKKIKKVLETANFTHLCSEASKIRQREESLDSLIFAAQLARYVYELSTLRFSKIGCRSYPDGSDELEPSSFQISDSWVGLRRPHWNTFIYSEKARQGKSTKNTKAKQTGKQPFGSSKSRWHRW